MPNVLKNSQYGFAISKLGPNQIMLIAEEPQLSIYDESTAEGVLVLTLSGEGPLALNYIMQNFGMIKTAVLSERTEEIGGEVFAGQNRMTVCDGTSNVKSIGNASFAECSSMENIDLSNVETIDDSAFVGCLSLRKVNLPKVKSISNRAFESCTNAEITLNDNVEFVDDGVFEGIAHLYYHGSLEGAPWGALAWN